MNNESRVMWTREDEILEKMLVKYPLRGIDGEPLNPYCMRMMVPFSNDEKMVRDFANDFFHELDTLDEDVELEFGERTDYCSLEKDDENACYYVTFNHHHIVELEEDDDGYEYTVAATFDEGDDDDDEFSGWDNDEDAEMIERPDAKRREELELIVGSILGKYRICVMVGEINPYCYNTRVEGGAAEEKTIVKAFNDLFHELGVLPGEITIGIGEVGDYCEIYKEDGAYFAPFNDPVVVGIGNTDQRHRYILREVRRSNGR